MTRAELAPLARLTRTLAEALTQGDLDRALLLLKERRRALGDLTWPAEADHHFLEEVRALRELEGNMLAFCRTWQKVMADRLKLLNQGQALRITYTRF